MISLKIQNLILIEKAEITFGAGLNILTGETGSGKSAILSAIRLIAGERADASCIRKGTDLAVVEAVLEGPIYIRREIHRSGKNRCFIDDEQVTVSALRERANIEVIDQNSAQKIFETQKEMLDTFAQISDEVAKCEASCIEERALEAKLQLLLQTPKDRELEWAQKDLTWIEEVNWQKGEDAKLSEEHHFLTHAQELCEKMQGITFALSEENHLPTLKRVYSNLESAARVDTKLVETAKAFKSALIELEEVASTIQTYTDRLEANPEKLASVEKRIADIEALKKRFGADIDLQREKLSKTIDHLSNLESEIESLRDSLEKLRAQNKKAMQVVTEKRKKASPRFSALILDELKSLNIPQAKFEIAVGDTFNEISFLFSANPGVPVMPLQDCASGGELSRVFLSIKTILSAGHSTLVFDEIDGNVGGQTASVVGEKLKRLSQNRQVICVTHFVQVAKHAIDHFLVSKREKEGSSYTSIAKLNEKERQIEFHRMMGTVQ